MTSISNLSDIINRLTGGNSSNTQMVQLFKDGVIPTGGAAVAPVIGSWSSLWQYVGEPSNGIVPSGGTATVPTNATAGSAAQTDPTAGQQSWLLGVDATCLTSGTLLLYDRLLHVGGLNATTTTAQNVGGTLTRYTDGAGNHIVYEIYTQIGATLTTMVGSYTDQAGNPQVTEPVNIGATGNREAQRMAKLPLASGTTGVQAVSSVQLVASTGTAGAFGINIIHPICYLQMTVPGVLTVRDFITGLPTVPEIKTGACLALAWYANTVTVPQVFAELSIISE